MSDQRVMVVTGGSSGLGAALASHYVRRGDAVVMNYRSAGKDAGGVGTAGDRKRPGRPRFLPFRADVTRRDEVQALFARIACVKRFGPPQVLIHSAGVNRDAPFLELTDALWDEVMNAHLKSAFICCQEFLRHNPDGPGHIVTLGAACGLQGRVNGANFCSAKGGIAALTKCLARELAPRVQVNCLLPSAVDTEEVRERFHLDEHEGRAKLLDRLPMGRIGELEDAVQMADAILGAKFTTGATFLVNGGEFMH